jgi:hypothetical protein
LDSTSPEEGPIGATLEIQRTQQIEAFEQQLLQQQVISVIKTIIFKKHYFYFYF